MKCERCEMEPLLSHTDIPPGRRLYYLSDFSKSSFSSYPKGKSWSQEIPLLNRGVLNKFNYGQNIKTVAFPK